MNTSDRTMALVALASIVGGAAWHFAHATTQPARPRSPVAWLALCDGSDSGTGQGCTPEALATLATRWVRVAAGRAGSSFVVLGVGTTRDGATVLFQRTIPESWGPNALGARNEFVAGLGRDLRALPITTTGSALVEALQVAIRRLGEHAGPHRLVVLSDLRQYTRGTWNFEGHVPRTAVFESWITRQRLGATLPTDASLFVCGVHSLRGQTRHAQSARLDEQRRALWTSVFARMGAPVVELHAACDADTIARIPAEP